MLPDSDKNITTLAAKLCKEETLNKFYGEQEENQVASSSDTKIGNNQKI